MARLLILMLAAASIAFVVQTAMSERDRMALAPVLDALEKGEVSAAGLAPLGPVLDRHAGDCDATFRRAASMRAVAEAAPDKAAAGIETVKAELRCSPMAVDAWLDLAILEDRAGDREAEIARHLDLSYRYGPREARLAARRVLFACERGGVLDARAVDDFRGAIESGLAGEAADAYRACGIDARIGLDVALADLAADSQIAFARALAAEGGEEGVR